jgi:predicted RNase H-like HicB family nuclease
MEKMIKALVYFDGTYYCAKCLEFDIFTQGKTIDETIKNLKEAVQVHFEGIKPAEYGLSKDPGLLIMLESDISLSHA